MSIQKLTPFLIFLFSLSPWILKSQDISFPKHTLVLDAGGIGGYGSINYEHAFYLKKEYLLSLKVGFSFFRLKDFERELNPDLLFPISIQYYQKFNHHQAVLGIGQTISSIVKSSSDFSSKVRKNRLSFSYIIGYRYQKDNNPFSIQISYTPVFEQYKTFQHWGGISFGYSFFQKKQI